MFTLVGALVALGLRQIAQAVPVVAVIVGAVLAVAGLATVLGRPIDLGRFSARSRQRGKQSGNQSGPGVRRMVAFGAGYAVASLSCTLGVLLAVVAQATATGQPAQTIAVFAAYATGATTILVSVAIATSLAHAGLTAAIRRAMPAVSRIGGVLLTASGIYLVIYWSPAITGHPPATGVAGLTDGLSGQISRTVDTHPAIVMTIVAALVVAALIPAGSAGSAGRAARRRRSSNLTVASATPAAQPDCGCEPVITTQHGDGPVQ